jgi:hypothetical protein
MTDPENKQPEGQGAGEANSVATENADQQQSEAKAEEPKENGS